MYGQNPPPNTGNGPENSIQSLQWMPANTVNPHAAPERVTVFQPVPLPRLPNGDPEQAASHVTLKWDGQYSTGPWPKNRHSQFYRWGPSETSPLIHSSCWASIRGCSITRKCEKGVMRPPPALESSETRHKTSSPGFRPPSAA